MSQISIFLLLIFSTSTLAETIWENKVIDRPLTITADMSPLHLKGRVLFHGAGKLILAPKVQVIVDTLMDRIDLGLFSADKLNLILKQGNFLLTRKIPAGSKIEAYGTSSLNLGTSTEIAENVSLSLRGNASVFGRELSIKAGTSFSILENSTFTVYKKITINGSPFQRVEFSGDLQARGLVLKDSDPNMISSMEHVVFRGLKVGLLFEGAHSTATIKNIKFLDNGIGISSFSPQRDVTISKANFDSNQVGIEGRGLHVTNSKFSYNKMAVNFNGDIKFDGVEFEDNEIGVMMSEYIQSFAGTAFLEDSLFQKNYIATVVGVSVKNCDFKQNNIAVQGVDRTHNTAFSMVERNNFFNSNIYLFYMTKQSLPMLLKNNYFGSTDEEAILNSIHDFRRNPELPAVDISNRSEIPIKR